MTMAACDLPTAAPIVEQRWIVPGATSRIAVATLLPAGVSILPDSSGFTLNAAMATVARPLSDDCALCVAGNGFTGLKPAMVINAAMSSKLASDISSATLTGGLLALSVTNKHRVNQARQDIDLSTPSRALLVSLIDSMGSISCDIDLPYVLNPTTVLVLIPRHMKVRRRRTRQSPKIIIEQRRHGINFDLLIQALLYERIDVPSDRDAQNVGSTICSDGNLIWCDE